MRKPSEACTAGQRASQGNHREPHCNKTYNQKDIVNTKLYKVRLIYFLFVFLPIIRAIHYRCKAIPFLSFFCFYFVLSLTAKCSNHSWSNDCGITKVAQCVIVCLHVVSCLSVSWTDQALRRVAAISRTLVVLV